MRWSRRWRRGPRKPRRPLSLLPPPWISTPSPGAISTMSRNATWITGALQSITSPIYCCRWVGMEKGLCNGVREGGRGMERGLCMEGGGGGGDGGF